jgi:hypothetical protein
MLIFCFKEEGVNDVAGASNTTSVQEWREENVEVEKRTPTGRVVRVIEKHGVFMLTAIANVFLFERTGDSTLVHEVMHSLSLDHTHRDWVAPNIPGTKNNPECFRYIFPEETTTNIMSYSRPKYSTWHWQWEIMQDFLTQFQDKGQT